MAHVVEEHSPGFASDYSYVAFGNVILVMGTDATHSLFLMLVRAQEETKAFLRENTHHCHSECV